MHFKITLFAAILWSLWSIPVHAQSCLTDGITFTSQEEVDSFPANYPGCMTILGDVTISYSSVTNLDSLAQLIAIDGSLVLLGNDSLSSLSGLASIVSIGKDLIIQDNDSLFNLSGFTALQTVGRNVQIQENNALIDPEGLDLLTTIGGDLLISDNDGLTNLNGLEGLLTIGGDLVIEADSSLTSLMGIQNLQSLGKNLSIRQNPLITNLESLQGLSAIAGNLHIFENSILANLSGLDSITSVIGDLIIGNNDSLVQLTGLNALISLSGDLEIYGNASLTSLTGLDSLATIGEFLRIYQNPVLTSLTGIQHINLKTLTELYLNLNDVLSFCSTPNICKYLSDPANQAFIADNDPGCNDRPEVIADCVIPCNMKLVAVASPENICIGSTSLIFAAVADGQQPYKFIWSTGDTVQEFLIAPVITTSYSVTVTDANGCTLADTVTVIVNPLPIAIANNNTPVCKGATINLTASGGASYFWLGPNNFISFLQNPTILNAQSIHAGIYSVVVTDLNGCSAAANTTVVVNQPPSIFAGSNSPVCVGLPIQFFVTPGMTYKWSGPQAFSSTLQNPSIPSALSANGGTYNVTVTDTHGCSASTSTSVTILSNPNAFATNDSPKCEGATITLNSSGGTSYSWSGPNGFVSTNKSPILTNIQLNQAGNYTVTVTGSNGCKASKTTPVVVIEGPNAFADNTGPACIGQDVDLYASGGSDYLWSGPNGYYTNDQNPTLFDLKLTDAGTYTVTITNNTGCSATASTELIVNAVSLTISDTDENCAGCNNGSATVSASGANNYTYLWSNGKTTSTITGLSPGVYSVAVTGSNGCSAIAVATINAFNCLTITLTPTVTNAVCHGQNGMASIVITGGAPPTTTLWSNNANTNTITAPAGTYSVLVTDANNCAESIQVTITEPDKLITTVMPFPVTCEGLCNGVASATAIGGVKPYSWNWNTGSKLKDIFNLCPGQYSITVIDANNCINIVNPITIAPGLSVKPVITGDTFICGDETGTLSVQGNYSFYSWSNGAGTPSINWTNPGVYSVTVTQSGCSGTATVNTVANPEIQLSLSFVGDTIYAIATGGTPPFSYLWSTGAGTQNISPNASGTYSVIVIDQQDCGAIESIEVIVNSLFTANTLPFHIYPNPVYDQLYVELPASVQEVKVSIYSVDGRLVWKKEIIAGQSSMNVSTLQPGSYFLLFNADGQMYRTGFVKQ
jgi:hypothetical protein